jgi:hypothetical protein
MSTIKADAVTTKSDNTDLVVTGGGSGVPDIEAGFKVGGTAGVPMASIRTTSGTASSSTFLRGDGTWNSAGGGAWTLIGTSTASDSASLDITGLSNTYDTYACVAAEIVPAGDNKWFYMRMGDGSFQTDNNYEFHQSKTTVASGSYVGVAGGDAQWYLGTSVGNAAGEGINAVLYLSSGSLFPTIHGTVAYLFTDGTGRGGQVFGKYNTVITEVDRVQVFFNSGNIATGRFSVYGIKHS